MENHLGELWSLFRVLFPGFLGSHQAFRDRFALAIERDGDAVKREALARVIRPFVLRRHKSEVARELPARTETDLRIELKPRERERYEKERLAMVASLTGAAATAD